MHAAARNPHEQNCVRWELIEVSNIGKQFIFCNIQVLSFSSICLHQKYMQV